MRQVAFISHVAVLVVAVIAIGAIPASAQFLSPVPQQPQQPPQTQPQLPQPAADPRAERIKAGLQQQGYRVLEVAYEPQRGNDYPYWVAQVTAQYAQPNWNPILKHAFDAWNVIFPIAAQEAPQTRMISDQFWTKYSILMFTSVGEYAEVGNRLRAAATQQEKSQIVDQFIKTIRFKVWDVERRQLVDQQDFVNKNFVR